MVTETIMTKPKRHGQQILFAVKTIEIVDIVAT